MTARILIDPALRMVFTQAKNPLTFAQVQDHRERLHKDKRFDPSFHQILSFQGVDDISLTTEQLRKLAAPSVFDASSRRAFIIPMDALFGMGRMFASYREIAGEPNISIVRSLLDAAAWVGIDLATATQAFRTLRSTTPTPES